jgi:predicted RNA polymerase sigma factor
VNAAPVLQRVYREHRARMLAALIRVLGNFELAEDAVGHTTST